MKNADIDSQECEGPQGLDHHLRHTKEHTSFRTIRRQLTMNGRILSILRLERQTPPIDSTWISRVLRNSGFKRK